MKAVYNSNHVCENRLAQRRYNRLLEHFVARVTARAIAEIIGVQPNTAIRFYVRLRFLIASQLPPKRKTRQRSSWQSGCIRLA